MKVMVSEMNTWPLTSLGGRALIIRTLTLGANVSCSRCWGFRPRDSQMDGAHLLGRGEMRKPVNRT